MGAWVSASRTVPRSVVARASPESPMIKASAMIAVAFIFARLSKSRRLVPAAYCSCPRRCRRARSSQGTPVRRLASHVPRGGPGVPDAPPAPLEAEAPPGVVGVGPAEFEGVRLEPGKHMGFAERLFTRHEALLP